MDPVLPRKIKACTNLFTHKKTDKLKAEVCNFLLLATIGQTNSITLFGEINLLMAYLINLALYITNIAFVSLLQVVLDERVC